MGRELNGRMLLGESMSNKVEVKGVRICKKHFDVSLLNFIFDDETGEWSIIVTDADHWRFLVSLQFESAEIEIETTQGLWCGTGKASADAISVSESPLSLHGTIEGKQLVKVS